MLYHLQIAAGLSQTKTQPPVNNQASMTTRSISLMCVSAAEHHTAEQYYTMGRTSVKFYVHSLSVNHASR